MNAIETMFYTSVVETLDSGFILQHIKPTYRIIGRPETQPDEEADIDCEKYVKICYETFLKHETEKSSKGIIFLYISTQTNINGYKLDFFLQSDVPNVCMAIEIDGHEWHEKTKEQASSDKKRERILLSRGIPCIRFTGSDVFTNSAGCAKEALQIYFNYYFETLFSTPENWESYFKGRY